MRALNSELPQRALPFFSTSKTLNTGLVILLNHLRFGTYFTLNSSYVCNIHNANIGEVVTHVHASSEQLLFCSGVCGQLTVGVAGSAHFLEDWWTSARLGLPPGSLPTTRFQGLLVTDGKVSGSFYISLQFCIPLETKKKVHCYFSADGVLFCVCFLSLICESSCFHFGFCHIKLWTLKLFSANYQ